MASILKSKGSGSSKNSLWVVGSILLAILIIWFGIYLSKKVPVVGDQQVDRLIDFSKAWGPLKYIPNIIGIGDTNVKLGAFVIYLAVFLIIFVSFSDILVGFSSFNTAISWIIGFCIAEIAAFSGGVSVLARLFGATGTIGAIGVAIIILASIFAAVVLNIGVGGKLREWRMKRQVEIEAHKSYVGSSRVVGAIRGLKEIDREFAEK